MPLGAAQAWMEGLIMSQSTARELVSNNAVLYLPDGQTVELPVITGTENENAIDIAFFDSKRKVFDRGQIPKFFSEISYRENFFQNQKCLDVVVLNYTNLTTKP